MCKIDCRDEVLIVLCKGDIIFLKLIFYEDAV